MRHVQIAGANSLALDVMLLDQVEDDRRRMAEFVDHALRGVLAKRLNHVR